MPHRILYLSRTWATGGPQTILLTLIRHLPRQTFQIVVAPYNTGQAADEAFARAAAEAGATIAASVPWRGLRSWSAAREVMAGLVRDYRIDLVHSHENMSNTLVGLNRRRLGVPVVASAFGWWELNLKLKAYYAIERRFILPRFDAVYTVSHDMAAKLRGGGTADDRIAVIYTGIDAAAWLPRGRRAAPRLALGIAPDALVLGAVGRISFEKGHDFLLRAMARLAPEVPQLVAVLAGTGPDVERLRALAAELGLSDRLIMPGYVNDAAEMLEAFDVAVLPSVLEEGFPTSSIEAQAVGLPVVASDIGGVRETLVEGITGFLCPPGNDVALADTLRRLLVDPALRTRMGAAARRRIAESFTLEQMLERFLAFYAKALDMPRAR